MIPGQTRRSFLVKTGKFYTLFYILEAYTSLAEQSGVRAIATTETIEKVMIINYTIIPSSTIIKNFLFDNNHNPIITNVQILDIWFLKK